MKKCGILHFCSKRYGNIRILNIRLARLCDFRHKTHEPRLETKDRTATTDTCLRGHKFRRGRGVFFGQAPRAPCGDNWIDGIFEK